MGFSRLQTKITIHHSQKGIFRVTSFSWCLFAFREFSLGIPLLVSHEASPSGCVSYLTRFLSSLWANPALCPLLRLQFAGRSHRARLCHTSQRIKPSSNVPGRRGGCRELGTKRGVSWGCLLSILPGFKNK